jgi:hypothetical protein
MKSPRNWSPALWSVLREIQRRYPSIDAEIDLSGHYLIRYRPIGCGEKISITLKDLIFLCLDESPAAQRRRGRGPRAVQ